MRYINLRLLTYLLTYLHITSTIFITYCNSPVPTQSRCARRCDACSAMTLSWPVT